MRPQPPASPSCPAHALAVLCCCWLSSCSATPTEHLQDRWYNEALSLRFRPDGSLIYNSTDTGLTTGRYHFSGEMPPDACDEPVANLTLDLVRGNRVVRSQFEVQFLGTERIRIRPVAGPGRVPLRQAGSGIVVLKRAADDRGAGLAAAR
jgi:hypothetical protein